MTDEELNAIEAEHVASSPGVWVAEDGEGECGLTHYAACPRGLESPDELCPECEDWVPWATPGLRGVKTIDCGEYFAYTIADMRFCAHAHQYVPGMIAEIRQLHADLAEYQQRERLACGHG